MADNLEVRRQEVMERLEQLRKRKIYEDFMEQSDDFAYTNGKLSNHIYSEIRMYEKQLENIDQLIKEKK